MSINQEYYKIRECFSAYREKKILVYGMGIRAEKIVNALKEFSIMGVLHNGVFCGEFKGIPIIPWNEISEKTADILIVAATPENYEIIYRRIQDKCRVNHVEVLGYTGESLSAYFSNDINRLNLVKSCNKSKDELKAKLGSYDAISFDVFDTLVMRTVLDPWDIFDIVESRISERNIIIKNFKKYRREADIASKGGDIYQIYEILQKWLGLSDCQKNMILQIELECEKEALVSRRDMVEIMNYAYQKGKRVSLISNMYLPEKVYKEILERVGITQYHKLYVSCEYRTTKNQKLYEEYKRDVGTAKCLHIGDDYYADIVKPKEYAIDSYEVLSGFDMLKISDFHGILGHINNINEKSLIGLLISYTFNSPFAMNSTFGIVNIHMYKDIGRCFIAPIGVLYIQEIVQYIMKNQWYDGILFPARDGYLFYQMYERYKEQYGDRIKFPIAFYFLTSRKAALKAAIQSDEMFSFLKSYLSRTSAVQLLKSTLGVGNIDNKNSDESDERYIDRYKDRIIYHSECERKKYIAYMEKNGISVKKKYLFCEVESRGTTQYALNHIFTKGLDGFYMSRSSEALYSLSIYSIFDRKRDRKEMNSIVLKQYFQEMFLSNTMPSLQSFDEKGNPVYDIELRNPNEVNAVEQVIDGAYEFFEEYISGLYVYGIDICKELIEKLYNFCDKVFYIGECEKMSYYNVYDNFLDGKYNALTNRSC